MKFIVNFKTPDAVNDAIKEYARQWLPEPDSLEDESLLCDITDKLQTCALKWVHYGECISVEFDTEADTATVIPRSGK